MGEYFPCGILTPFETMVFHHCRFFDDDTDIDFSKAKIVLKGGMRRFRETLGFLPGFRRLPKGEVRYFTTPENTIITIWLVKEKKLIANVGTTARDATLAYYDEAFGLDGLYCLCLNAEEKEQQKVKRT